MKALNWTPALNRERLTDMLSSREGITYGESFSLKQIPELAPGEVRLGRWGNDSSSDQWQVMLVRAGEQRDLLAWMTTYFPKTAPITQWCRVVDSEELSAFEQNTGGGLSSWTAHIWANIVLGECYAQMRDPVGLSSLSTQAALSCETFVAARARAIGSPAHEADRIAERWSQMLHTVGQSRRLPRERLRFIWGVLDKVSSSPTISQTDTISAALNEIIVAGELSERRWLELGQSVGIQDVFMAPSDTQEERLKAYDRLIASIPHTAKDDSVAFLVGCAASTVGNGKLDFLDLLKPVLEDYPSAPLWFALHAALVAKTAIGAEFAGFGRRIAREILAQPHIDEPSSADIGAQEVAMILSTGQAALQSVRGFTKTTLLVEVAPFVVAALPIGQRDRDLSTVDNQRNPSARKEATRGLSRGEVNGLLENAIGQLMQIKQMLKSDMQSTDPRGHESESLPLAKTRSRSKKPKQEKRGLFG